MGAREGQSDLFLFKGTWSHREEVLYPVPVSEKDSGRICQKEGLGGDSQQQVDLRQECQVQRIMSHVGRLRKECVIHRDSTQDTSFPSWVLQSVEQEEDMIQAL